MQQFRADLHIHTLLSPCGDLEMSPANIVDRAAELNLQIIGIADHNATQHGPLVKKLALQKGIFTLCGAEVTTKEETHCLAFFKDNKSLIAFQKYLDAHLPDVKNDPKYFGYQVVIDEQEMIVEEVQKLLISALDQSVDQVESEVHKLGGLFIPAHIDRAKFSLISQLGFVPPGLNADAFEISFKTTKDQMLKQFPYLSNYSFIRSSDAHYPNQLGNYVTIFEMEEISFDEIRKALKGVDGRKVIIHD